MEEVAALASRYITMFGHDAVIRVEADVSRAIGRAEWDDYTRLQKVRLRIQRLEALRVAATCMTRSARRARGHVSAI